jgi:integrase
VPDERPLSYPRPDEAGIQNGDAHGNHPVQQNPIELVTVKSRPNDKPAKQKRVFTPEEFMAIAEELPEPYRTMVYIAGCLGLRVSDFVGLQWWDIDFEPRNHRPAQGGFAERRQGEDQEVGGDAPTRSTDGDHPARLPSRSRQRTKTD